MATGAEYEVVDVSSGEEITDPGANDVMVAFHKSTGALEKIDYNKLAKAIIEQYTGSTIGGAAQSVKAAVDTVSNAIVVKNMPSSADFNNYTETGVWRCDLLETAVTNGPPVGTYVSGFLFVSKYNSNNIIQRFCFSGSSKDELTRFNWNGTWSAWVKQPTRAEMDIVTNKLPYYDGAINVTAEVVTRTLSESLASYSMIMISYFVNANTFLGSVILPILQFKNISSGIRVYHQRNANEYATVTYVDDTHITAVTTNTGNRYIAIMLL